MKNTNKKIGFSPVCNQNSRILILGSFPSVKSREIEFYYGHKQNRFWKMLYGYFGKSPPETVEEKKEFLFQHGIALWDMVMSCEIEGSSDASVKNAETVDLNVVFEQAKIEKIFLNGSLAYELFIKNYSNIEIPYVKLPSTSPANPKYKEEIWWRELDEIFRIS